MAEVYDCALKAGDEVGFSGLFISAGKVAVLLFCTQLFLSLCSLYFSIRYDKIIEIYETGLFIGGTQVELEELLNQNNKTKTEIAIEILFSRQSVKLGFCN